MQRVLVASLVLGSLLAACSSDSGGGAAAGSAGAGGAGAGAQGGSPGAGAGGAAAGTSAAGGGAGGAAAGAAGAAGAATSDLPCAVNKLLVSRCQSCHAASPKFGAPMPLVTRADLLALATTDTSTTVAALAVARMRDDAKPMPQPPNPRATEAEIAAFEAWVGAGMPPGSPGDCSAAGGAGGSAGQGGAAGGPAGSGGAGPAGAGGTDAGGAAGAAGGTTTACTPDQVVKANKPWTIKQSAVDQYVCFGGTIPASPNKRHITEVSVKIDNEAHAHHLCVYDLGSNAVPTEPQTCGAASSITKGKLLYCWAPGATPQTLPPEAGFPLEAGKDTNILIEMHYSNIQGAPDSTDNSAATFCTTEQLRPDDADVMAFGSNSFSLPPHQKTTVENVFTIPTGILPGNEIKVIRGWPHMHLLGVGQSTSAARDGAPFADLASTSTYSFQNQIGYPLDVTLRSKDVITTKCFFQNNTDSTVTFGEDTQSEMCYNFVTYYPRITSKQWVWAAPAFLGKNSVYPTK